MKHSKQIYLFAGISHIAILLAIRYFLGFEIAILYAIGIFNIEVIAYFHKMNENYEIDLEQDIEKAVLDLESRNK